MLFFGQIILYEVYYLPSLSKFYLLGREEMDLAVKYLENLPKVSRFDMIIMCLSSTERAGMFS